MNYFRTNSKLRKDKIISFDLPAVKTCPGAGECKKFCYASCGTFRFRAAIALREFNLRASLSDNFETRINDEIKRRRLKIIRLHSSGDFYSTRYIQKWIRIMKANPSVQFYAYTKSIHLFKLIDEIPPNFKLIYSYGSLHDKLIEPTDNVAKIFNAVEDIDDGYVDCGESDLTAVREQKIALVYHGQKARSYLKAA